MEQKLQNATPSSNHFWIFSNFFWIFFSVFLTKVLFWIFKILSLWFLTNIFLVLLTWDHRGAKISKRYSYYKSILIFSKLLDFLVNDPHKSTVLDFWNHFKLTFWFLWFSEDYYSLEISLSPLCYGETINGGIIISVWSSLMQIKYYSCRWYNYYFVNVLVSVLKMVLMLLYHRHRDTFLTIKPYGISAMN